MATRVGRPPRINRQMIAEAAHELGMEQLTLKAVADHLDVSIAALYHYVSGKDDLLRLAAEYAASQIPLPEDHGQHWAVWMYEWAVYNRDVFLARPGLLAQYLEGAVSAETIAGRVDSILGGLVRQGFTVAEANAVYELVSTSGVGTAVSTLREREFASAGSSLAREYVKVLRESPPDALPHLRGLLRESGRQPFEEVVATILMGVALRRGDDPEEIATLVRQAARA